MSGWRTFFGLSNPKTHDRPAKGEDTFQSVLSDQPHNPYTEVRLLAGHSNLVHQLAHVDEGKFVSASDDGTAVVWDAETGMRRYVLQGHRERVTCVLPLQPFSEAEMCIIMTASTDRTVRLWDLGVDERMREGLCQRVSTEHEGPIFCLVQLSHDIICSGGQDLCLWDRNAKLLSKYDRCILEETSHIHSVLKLDSRHFGVVAASNYKSLGVYDIVKSPMTQTDRYELKFVRYIYSSHREEICCLTSISNSFFASGSKDGVILLWSTNTLSAMKMFYCLDSAPKEPLVCSPFSEIRYISVIGERYLFAAIGNGFKVYDVLTYEDSHGHPKPLACHTSAHQQPITHMEFLEDRSVLVTASEDNTVRLWGHVNKPKRENEGGETQSTQGKICIEDFLGIELNPQRVRRRGGPSLPVVPTLLGELLLHSSQVKVVMDMGKHGLVTCGADNMIIIWKDAEKERDKRDVEIRAMLKGDSL